MKGEVTKLGKKFYEEYLKAILEPQKNGKFVAIEPDNEEYFVGKTAVEALSKGGENFPEKIFFSARIGFPTARKFGGSVYNKSNR